LIDGKELRVGRCQCGDALRRKVSIHG
jgi:hypothetical protein